MDPKQPSNHHNPTHAAGSSAAADLIRQKLDRIYGTEPNVQTEIVDSAAAGTHRTKHQQFMFELSNSGKPLAEIQAAWHNYYAGLSDEAKHEVWQEFYDAHANGKVAAHEMVAVEKLPEQPLEPIRPEALHTNFNYEDLPSATTHRAVGIGTRLPKHQDLADRSAQAKKQAKHHAGRAVKAAKTRATTAKQHLEKLKKPRNERTEQSVAEVQEAIVTKAATRAKLTPKHHLKALGFGLASGAIVVAILLFSFFNERFVAPFITPSRTVSATPIIIDPNKTTTVSKDSKVIIPKINVEVPVIYDLGSIEEKAIQNALENGVVHYDTTSSPGEKGNVIIFGHSSNNILNKGKYKFAFVLLNRLENGDIFMLQKDGKQYVYKVFNKRVVKPEEVNILSESPKPAMATLITCDPPGTSINRLLVEAEQISPDPTSNGESTAKAAKAGETTTVVPSNAPSLLDRIRDIF